MLCQIRFVDFSLQEDAVRDCPARFQGFWPPASAHAGETAGRLTERRMGPFRPACQEDISHVALLSGRLCRGPGPGAVGRPVGPRPGPGPRGGAVLLLPLLLLPAQLLAPAGPPLARAPGR